MTIARFAILGGVAAAAALIAQTAFAFAAGAGTPGLGVVVHPALGGQILGYDVDQNGSAGILSEFVALQNGNSNVAVETFDQKTGKIKKIVKEERDTLNDFSTFPVVGTSVGLVLYQKDSSGRPIKNVFETLDPLRNNRFTGKWTPKLAQDQAIGRVSEDQGQTDTAVMTFDYNGNAETSLFTSNVAANRFGSQVTLSDPIFDFNTSPVMAYDSATNTAVVASSDGCRTCGTELALADMTLGSVSEFAGLGIGTVNGIAIDSADGIACTTTEIDFGVEFYDLATQTGFEVSMEGANSQLQSGQDVEYDPVNKLFLIGQVDTSTGNSGSSVQVFDTQGNFVEAINGLDSPSSPVLIALNPNTRTAFIIVAHAGNELQSFSY